jgi:cold-inducible RNA-binding protein
MQQQKKIYIGNIPFNTDETSLRSVFSSCGSIEDVHIPTDRESGRARGFAFVTFDTEEAATKALEKNGEDLGGRQLRISLANSDRDKGTGGGGRSAGGARR